MFQAIHAFKKHLFFAAAIAALSGNLFAQTASTTEPTTELQEVTVTGSRIPVPPNITATSPITIVSAQEIGLQGHTDITDVINQLPQNIIGSANDFGNTSSPLTSTGGFSTVDLRGLGPQRTLVLVNGRRLGVGDPSTSNQAVASDIDQIPLPLLERVVARYLGQGTWARDPLLRRDGYDYLERILLDGAFIRRGQRYEDLVDTAVARQVMAETR